MPTRILRLWMLLAATVVTGECLTVTDQKGRSIDIEVISVTGDTVTFTKQGSPKRFTLPVGNFDEASQALIRTQQPASAAEGAPQLQADVVIGKRRKDRGDSYYMKVQEITCTIKLTNGNKNAAAPPVTTKIVFIGQNTRTPAVFKVLSAQTFDFSLQAGETVAKETEAFSTSYDSDNKGVGNVGGYQYYGYVMAILNKEGKVISSYTTTGSFRVALAAKPNLIEQVAGYTEGRKISNTLE